MSAAALSVYDDKHKLGEIEIRAPRQVEAFLIVRGRRKSLGIFSNRQEAAQALDPPRALVAE